MKIIYARSRNLIVPVVRARFWSSWSHCGILTPDDTVIEATAWHGVREVPQDEFLQRMSAHEVVAVPTPKPLDGIRWARGQIGRPYDWLGAIGIGINRKWEEEDKWFCSELVERVFVEAGRRRFRSDTWRIDPQTSYNVL